MTHTALSSIRVSQPRPSSAGQPGSVPFVAHALIALAATALLCAAGPASAGQGAGHAQPDRAAAANASRFGKIPLAFEPNHGQSDPRVQFLAHGPGYSLFLAPGEAVVTLERQAGATPASKIGASRHERPPMDTLRMEMIGANRGASVTGLNRLEGTVNYFAGSDPKNWHSGIPTYAKVSYAGVYPGIDLVFYGNQRQLEYDFVVAPGADAGKIAWRIDGAKLSLDANGDLDLSAPDGPAGFKKPAIYQKIGNTAVPVDGHYAIAGNEVRFALGRYDHSKPLVIDPVLSYATFLGAAVNEYSATDGYSTIGSYTGFYPSGISNPTQAMGIDGEGHVVVVGTTNATDFPLHNSYEGTPAGPKASSRNFAAFVTKFNAEGTGLVYSTYLSGENDADTYATTVAEDEEGNVYVAGYTNDGSFPVTEGAYQTICGANWQAPGFTRINGCAPEAQTSSFVAKIDPTGSKLIYSTFLGGQVNDYISAISIDANGRAYVAGDSDDYCNLQYDPTWACFPTTDGAIISGTATSGDFTGMTFLTVFNPEGSKLIYSTYVGDKAFNFNTWGETDASAVAVDPEGDFFLAGTTRSPNLSVTPGAFQKSPKWLPDSCCQGFVAKFKPVSAKGSSLEYMTYIGGPQTGYGTFPSGLAAGSGGEIYITGLTIDPKYPVSRGAYQTACGLGSDSQCHIAFVTKLNAAGTQLEWSTMLGDATNSSNTGVNAVGPIVLDREGNVYIAGEGSSAATTTGFPQVYPIQTSTAGGASQAFVSKFNPTGTKLLFSTLVGSGGAIGTQVAAGLAVDKEQNIYLAGNTNAKGSVHVTRDAFQRGFEGTGDGFAAKIVMIAPTTTKLTAPPSGSIDAGKNFELVARVTSAALSPIPGGEVTFERGSTRMGTAMLDASGTATFKTSVAKAGSFTYSASYAGDSFDAASASVKVTVTAKAADAKSATVDWEDPRVPPQE